MRKEEEEGKRNKRSRKMERKQWRKRERKEGRKRQRGRNGTIKQLLCKKGKTK